jgi:5-methylcytosine-specific restriction endonuclease McrA
MARNDAEAIVDLYKSAAIKTMITGVKHQVDHIIPLNHPDVCGLHVSWNMDILTAEDNVRKSNNFDPTDPRVYPDLYSASQASLLNRQRKHANLRLVGSEYYAEKEALYAH